MPSSPRSAERQRVLAGATVVVTRPTGSAVAMKRRIVALGGNAIGLPGTSVRGPDDVARARAALRSMHSVDFVIFVSPNAVRFAFTIAPDLRFARSTCVCAIGAATARALRRRGLRDAIWPRLRQDSEGLLALPEFAAMRKRRVAIVDAPLGRDLLSRELVARGAKVARVHVYTRTAARLDRRHFEALATAAAPLFVQLSSADALAHLRERLPAKSFAKLLGADAVVGSARLAAAARAAGWRRVHIAASAAMADMIDATVHALARRRTQGRRRSGRSR